MSEKVVSLSGGSMCGNSLSIWPFLTPIWKNESEENGPEYSIESRDNFKFHVNDCKYKAKGINPSIYPSIIYNLIIYKFSLGVTGKVEPIPADYGERQGTAGLKLRGRKHVHIWATSSGRLI